MDLTRYEEEFWLEVGTHLSASRTMVKVEVTTSFRNTVPATQQGWMRHEHMDKAHVRACRTEDGRL